MHHDCIVRATRSARSNGGLGGVACKTCAAVGGIGTFCVERPLAPPPSDGSERAVAGELSVKLAGK